jgi:hypothetical protein
MLFVVVATLCFFIAPNSSVDAQQRFVNRLLNRDQVDGPVVSANFIVYANDRLLAARVSQAAEGFRKTLAAEWLGRELAPWPQKCPITVNVEPHAGGETSFAFMPDANNQMFPMDWEMKIFGPPDRLLDAVLPHEVTHTIFATHFRRPLPRWADEGACTTVEHTSEQRKNHRMLLEFLNTSRGIPFNRMFTLKQYPSDILPLYAQGFSLAKFLIFQKGKRHFLNYIDRGMQYEDQGNPIDGWNRATSEFYPFEDLSELQLSWVSWVREGSSKQAAAKLSETRLAGKLPTGQKFRGQRATDIMQTANSETVGRPPATLADTNQGSGRVRSLLDSSATGQRAGTFASASNSWYASQMQPSQQTKTADRMSNVRLRKVNPDGHKMLEENASSPASPQRIFDSRNWLPASSPMLR